MNLMRAGRTLRYHTWTVHHRENVAEHTFNVMGIYLERYGPMSPEVSTYILLHDVAEVVTGDMPFIMKRKYPVLKLVMDDAEADTLTEMGLELPTVSTEELYKIKICDLLSMKFYAEAEIAMGNEAMQEVVDNINDAVEKMQND